MKLKVRLLSLILAVVLFCALLVPTATADTAQEEPASQVKNKVVSVLFDDSGSMKAPIDRWNYARYALESLMSALGENDTLVITPMNALEKVPVDLKAEDRTQVIEDVMTKTFLFNTPGNAGTPAESIPKAVNVLKEYGMKTQAEIAPDEVSDKEYILLVLTDGQFDNVGTSVDAAAKLFVPDLSKYAFFQTIYVGFTEGALNLSGAAALQGYANFAGYKADTTTQIGQVMQQVANRITGRYAINVPFDPNSKTITIDLSSVPFSLRSVTVMAATTNARFDSATYSGGSVKVEQDARFTSPSGMEDVAGGFTAILAPSGSKDFSGGSITLTLNDAPGPDASISVMVEPALLLTPVITTEVNGKTETIDSAYINSHLTPGKQIFVSYILTEQYTGREVDPATLPGKTTAAVTYDGKSYAVGSGIPLKEGKKEIGISVSMMDGAYTLYASVPCVVLTNPTYFRIETVKTVAVSDVTYETTFRVYYNDAPIAAGALAGYNPTVTAVDENGGPIPVSPVRSNSDGTFTVALDLTDRAYGTYTLRATVTKDRNPRSVEAPVWFYPSGLTLLPDAGSLDVTVHGMLSNTKGFTFTLTDKDGERVSLENKETIGFTAKIGSLDVTEHCTVSGNTLTFVPTAKVLGTLAEKAGTNTLTVTVRYLIGTLDGTSASTTLNILPTRFEVVLLNGDSVGEVDRFNLAENQSSLYFAVLRDGVALSAEELQAALDEGLFSTDSVAGHPLSPVRSTQTVEAYNGTPAVRVRISEGHIAPLRFLVTSMLVFGDSVDVSVQYGDVTAAGAVPLASPGVLPYVWRILVLLYLLQLVLLALTYKSVKRVPKGTLVKLTLEGEGDEKVVTKGELVKHVRGMDRLLLPRLLPFAGLLFREKTVSVADNNVTTLRSNGAGVGVEISPYNTGKFTEYDANKPITSVTRQKYKENTTEGNLGRLKEKNITVAVKTEAKKQSGIIPLNEKEGYVTNPGGRRALLYLFIRPER